ADGARDAPRGIPALRVPPREGRRRPDRRSPQAARQGGPVHHAAEARACPRSLSRSLDDWLAYISAQHPATIALGLDRVRDVFSRMDVTPAEPAPAISKPGAGVQSPVVITIGGTNGKGSTCAILERILLEAGYKIGLYTSPHLLRYNERVHLDGEEASDAALVAGFEAVEKARGDTPLTYFEYGTLAALKIFSD